MEEVFTSECYATIPGYPGYLVGTDGSILSNFVFGSAKRRTSPKYRRMSTRYSKANHYTSVELFGDSGSKRLYVHRLVLEAFSGSCPAGMWARHLDGDKSNNDLSNLVWDSKKENAQDRIRHGTDYFTKTQHGQDHHQAKLTDQQVQEIRDLKGSSCTQAEIGIRYGVRASMICRIWNGTRRSDT